MSPMTANPPPNQGRFGTSFFAIAVFVSFIIVSGYGVISISQSSSNGLVYTQLGLSLVGLLISFIQTGVPDLLQKVMDFMFRGRRVILERAISILLLCAVISLPFFIHQSSAVAQHILTPSPTPTLPPPTNFSVTTVSLRDGSILPNTHPLQIPVAGVPLQVTGTY